MEATRRTKVWRTVWMGTAMAAIVFVVYLVARPAHSRTAVVPPVEPTKSPPSQPVRVDADGTIDIASDSPLLSHMTTVVVNPKLVAYPIITVSGSILARIRHGSEPIEDRWQFSNNELATKYADRQRVLNEIEFATSQLAKTEELVKAETDYLSANVKRLEPLAKGGSLPEKDLKAAQTEFIKAKLHGEKDIFSAQSTLRQAQKAMTALERDLSQMGIEAVVFQRAVENMVLIAANVPESKVKQVHEGQGCLAKFFAYPDHLFDAHVETLGSRLSDERRTLRVLFELSDPESVLRPGMFAEVGLGTDEREALLIPADALLHVDMEDYVIVAAGPGKWRVAAIRTGDEHEGQFEVLSGLSPGVTVIGSGALLLKPAAIRILTRGRGGEDD